MKLEVGKYYRTRDGRKVGPMQKFNSYRNRHPWESHGCLWTDDGVAYLGMYPDQNIRAEWIDEPASPVRTVTRKEIVPGTYGKVRVTGGMYIHVNSMSTATELRAAIATLTQIAEALEQ